MNGDLGRVLPVTLKTAEAGRLRWIAPREPWHVFTENNNRRCEGVALMVVPIELRVTEHGTDQARVAEWDHIPNPPTRLPTNQPR